MFNRSLKERVKKLENKLWKMEHPNGELFDDWDSAGCGWRELKFKYFYNNNFYVADLGFPFSVSFNCFNIDYAKTNNGYIFTTPERTYWRFIQYGATKAVDIPKPCLHD